MKRKQQVERMLGMHYILYKIDVMYCTPIWEFFGPFLVVFCVRFLVVFRHMVSSNGFLILVKELRLLTNMGQCIRGLGVVGSYMYIVL
jgi:hypothetical protein